MKWIFFLLSALSAFSFGSGLVHATPTTIRINVVQATGPFGMTRGELRNLTRAVSKYYKNEMGLKIISSKFITIKDPAKFIFMSGADPWLRLYEYKDWSGNLGLRKRRTMWLVPPVREPPTNNLWWLGWSNSVCSRNGVAYSVAGMKGTAGKARWSWSKMAYAHELGHLLGASDKCMSMEDEVGDDTLMCTALLSFLDAFKGYVPIAEDSKWQIWSCLS